MKKANLRAIVYRRRRLMVSAVRRKVHWEFWPPYVFYIPVVGYVLYLGIRHRCLTLFTAANPGIPAGGIVGESKSEILHQLRPATGRIARYVRVDHRLPVAEQLSTVTAFMAQIAVDFPLVLKPDTGERGKGVKIIRSSAELLAYLTNGQERSIAQEYVPGLEFGVFYFRFPGDKTGHIFAITDKRFPTVIGDGQNTLETLILQHERAVCMAPLFFKNHRERLHSVPRQGETVPLVELGSHCRGSLFLDGMALLTPGLEAAVDEISLLFQGFYFGRYDIRTSSVEDFREGNFKIIELNGVTSEATSIYDPRNSLIAAYRVLFRQWRLAFEIGAANVRNGARPLDFRAFVKLVWKHVFAPDTVAGNAVTAADPAASDIPQLSV